MKLIPYHSESSKRRAIFEAWHYRCCYCGDSATTIDHLIPKSCGGSNEVSNLAPACLDCNGCKGSKPLKDWYQRQSFFNADRLDALERWQDSPSVIMIDPWEDLAGFAVNHTHQVPS